MPIEHKRSAVELALAVVPLVRAILDLVRRADRHLADQLKRATSSVALNLAEAEGNRDGNRRLRLETARGSAKEAKCALRLAVAWGYVTARDVEDAVDAMDRLAMMTWRMTRGRRETIPSSGATEAEPQATLHRAGLEHGGANRGPTTAHTASEANARHDGRAPGSAPVAAPRATGPVAAPRALGPRVSTALGNSPPPTGPVDIRRRV